MFTPTNHRLIAVKLFLSGISVNYQANCLNDYALQAQRYSLEVNEELENAGKDKGTGQSKVPCIE